MKTVIPHVMVFPYPAQGHINAMLGLSELLNIAGIRVTFITTEHILHKLSNTSLNNSADLLSFRAVPDGLPDDHDRSPQDRDLMHSLHMHAAPALRMILRSSGDLRIE
ncbi:UDP-glycosyltransferase 83A1 [Acorus calamus]|uniref:UDP-glycosyltransferase 83A1 n=1 Tax=Acorus calamus TaxID=4465 RepID=A0AAV9E9J8_ACOCL|nr:UDP-glycosyltransferase 83A1 [Acorus calamus]